MRKKTTVILALCGLLGTAGAASAQSYGAPAGRDPSTAPGGTEGLAGPRNEAESIRSGDAVEVAPNRGGVAIEEPALPPPSTNEAPTRR
ncbi:hypothetical protein [Methylobacterium pseudosasicola]|uniref:Uncharacterized protein n=1 Tax=Methylobacterium pseudosasicola TaxID=582667 RepID=A0A1I4PZU8_9HYPH|nr:hypothetical protein [Methylobacterium pseudosasicola]SFM33136.1 hypothetical protein SAMN05192568_102750 [Methylobacterium pseudosasicola]